MLLPELHRLLIVEDEPELRFLLKESLSRLALEIHLAEDGEQAFEMAMLERYDAILTDISLPKMTGTDFFEKLRQHHVQVPIVFLTASGDKDNLLRCLRLGAFDFIERPFQIDSLIQVVKKAIEVGSTQHRVEEMKFKVFHKIGDLDPQAIQEIQKQEQFIHKRRVENSKR